MLPHTGVTGSWTFYCHNSSTPVLQTYAFAAGAAFFGASCSMQAILSTRRQGIQPSRCCE